MPSNERTKIDAAKEHETAPHQHEWEAGVLAALVHHANNERSTVPALVLTLPPEAFERSDHRAVFLAVRALRQQGAGIDQATVQDWLATNRETVSPAGVAAIWTADVPAPALVRTCV